MFVTLVFALKIRFVRILISLHHLHRTRALVILDLLWLMENASVSGLSLSVLNIYRISNDIIILDISVCNTVLTEL